jgi:hypothetical protein
MTKKTNKEQEKEGAMYVVVPAQQMMPQQMLMPQMMAQPIAQGNSITELTRALKSLRKLDEKKKDEKKEEKKEARIFGMTMLQAWAFFFFTLPITGPWYLFLMNKSWKIMLASLQ